MRMETTFSRSTVLFVAFWVCMLFGVRGSHAQDEEAEAKRKRMILVQQLTCLKKCQDTYQPRLARCGRVDFSSSCFMYSKLYMTHCLRSCRADWFCAGFQKTYKQCPANCMKDEMKKIQPKWWNKRRKRWVRMSKAQIKSKMKRARRGCIGVCKIMGSMCSVDIPVIKSIKMPPLPR